MPATTGSHPFEYRKGSSSKPTGKLLKWIRMVPESTSTSCPLGQRLGSFFQEACKLVLEGEIGTRQQVITKIASEGGLFRVKELTDDLLASNASGGKEILHDLISPFFRMISQEDIMSSLLLESSIDTIHNFIFGPSGRRGVRVFVHVANLLSELDATDQSAIRVIEATLVVFQKIIDLNGTALILEEFRQVAETITGCLQDESVLPGNLLVQRARRSLSRIQRRLDLGEEISHLQVMPKQDLYSARFEIRQDLPGSLSTEGPRHDNDHVDITDIKIMPTAEEIQSQRIEYRPLRDPALLHLRGVQGLLDRHFRLLREDTIGQLRDAVGVEVERLRNKRQGQSSSPRPKQPARVNVYHGVQLSDLTFDKWNGLQITAEFDQPNDLRTMTENQRQDWWTNTRRLQIGCLLCLVDAAGAALFLSVADLIKGSRPYSDSVDDRLMTTTDQQSDDARPKRPNHFNDPLRAAFLLRLVETDLRDITQMVDQFGKQSRIQRTLVEFPGVLLLSFRPTLKAIQQMSRDGELPFAEVLAPLSAAEEDTHILPPEYALQGDFRWDLSCLLTESRQLSFSPNETVDLEVLRRGSTLDNAQASALVDALSRRFALIQGPPGTGKSFTGIALIKVLLQNRSSGHLGPIVCVCYTNHALDQLLEHLVRDGIQEVIRIGSRSKSQLLEPVNLWNVSQQQEKTKTEKHTEWELRCVLESISEEIEDLLVDLKTSQSWKSIKSYLETNQPDHHDELFGNEEDEFQKVRNHLDKIVPRWLHHRPGPNDHFEGEVRTISALKNARLQDMNHDERQKLYRYWVSDLTQVLRDNLRKTLNSYTETKDSLHQCRQELNLRCLREAQVIGVTTSGLARNIETLRRVNSKVMICEEAGEVLEAHLLTAMLPSIEHAILIGDHEQLRPQAQNYDLQHDNPSGEKYSLDVSLFERLVAPEGDWAIQFPFSVLQIQRRMHPWVAELVRRTLYPNLQDHQSVSDYPEVSGIGKRLFWIDHQGPDSSSDSSETPSTSFTNEFEVEFTAALVSHLVRQGKYQSDDIAVLTPYLGQLHRLRKRLSESHEIVLNDRDQEDLEKGGLSRDAEVKPDPPKVQKTTLLNALRIATVDNFQGEEAKIVVISLVRSNESRKCGFLKSSNRINVLLSRARHGMYIVGNSETSCHVPMWDQVLSILRANGNIGNALPLRCPRHPETAIKVSRADDFARLAPEGGCNEKCKLRLPCGHSCINKCHAETLHNSVMCLEPCAKSKAGCDHPCPRPCGQECEKLCHVKLKNILLRCGHDKATLECYKAQDISTVRCEKRVERSVPGCMHQVKVKCCVDVEAEDFKCDAICGAMLPCGHECSKKCLQCNTRKGDQVTASSHGKCEARCKRPYNNCSHLCASECHGEEPCPLCNASCEVQCAHSKCGKKCSEPCAPCAQACSWSCPHRGRCQMPCAVPCNVLPCSERCQEILPCGHQCPSICGERCPSSKYCQTCAADTVQSTMVDYIMQSTYGDVDLNEEPMIVPSCGHLMTLSSMDGHMSMSDYYELSEASSVTCLKPLPKPFSVENVKTCPICRGPLRDINRYNRMVRQGLLEQATKKFISWANQRFLPLEQRLYEEEKRLQQSAEETISPIGNHERQARTRCTKAILFNSSPVETIESFPGLARRYRKTTDLGVDIVKFLEQVKEEEQPFGRVYDMIRDIQRRRGITTDITPDQSVLNTRNRMLATLLYVRCELAILSDFVLLRQHHAKLPIQRDWIQEDFRFDFAETKQICRDIITEAMQRDQPMHEVEARVYLVRCIILERQNRVLDCERSKTLFGEAEQHLNLAKVTCNRYPGQTRGMTSAVLDVENMLKEDTFYTVVDDEEKRKVYEAMAQEFRGTGHWYTCVNGHPFTVGECGMPMQTSVCPQCGTPVGGQSHQPAEGVTIATDFEEQFGRLRLQ